MRPPQPGVTLVPEASRSVSMDLSPDMTSVRLPSPSTILRVPEVNLPYVDGAQSVTPLVGLWGNLVADRSVHGVAVNKHLRRGRLLRHLTVDLLTLAAREPLGSRFLNR